VAFTPDVQFFASVGTAPELVVWNLKDNKEHTRVELVDGSSGDMVAFLPSGGVAVTSSRGQISIREIDR
jgi:hypothetical protein